MKTKKKTDLWQQEFKAANKSAAALANAISISEETIWQEPAFPLRAPDAYLGKIRAGDINDPLLLQILPTHAEQTLTPGYVSDPLDEAHHNPLPGLIHKYHNRVLLTVSQACAIHCRYCFRQHFPYQENNPGKTGWQRVFAYILAHPEIDEVILSGGDPLSANDETLHFFVKQLAAIPHLRALRLHTRTAIAMPSRITPELLTALTSTHQHVIMVVHANHPNELDDEVQKTMARCRDAGITLLNQSVLLRGVNDNAETLCALSWRLFECHILPYYLHLLDPVQGTAHFAVEESRGRELIAACQATLPGYLVPSLVREEPGATSKTRKG